MQELTERKQQLLQLIVEHYIQTAEPVGSSFLVEHSSLGVSGATLRNEMRDLEHAGYLTHPHTSAGRIPTEQGYRYYIDHLMRVTAPSKKTKSDIEKEYTTQDDQARKVKQVAKFIAGSGNAAVIVAFDTDSIYYTGISNLFAQPEFRDYAQTMSVSSMFDQCEERVQDIFSLIDEQQAKILLGKDNPLGQACALVITPFGQQSFFSILGPMRMDYGRVVGLIDHIKTIL